MSRTKKPCPGCGEIEPSRASDEVCFRCRKKLSHYEALVRSVETMAFERKVVLTYLPYHYEFPYVEHGNPCANNDFRRVFYDLALACAVDYQPARDINPNERYGHFESALTIVTKNAEKFLEGQTCDSRGIAVFEPKTLAALRKFWKAMQPYVKAVYAEGLNHGTDLLGQLIRGEVTNAEINEAQKEALA